MPSKKHTPITLLHTDGPRYGGQYRVDIVPEKSGYTFRVCEETDDGDAEDNEPTLTAEEWGRVAIQLLLKCPDAKDPIGLSSATADGFIATGRTVGKRGSWSASLTAVGGDYNGRTLLEWSSSRPLSVWELGKAFKAMIGRLSEMAAAEDFSP